MTTTPEEFVKAYLEAYREEHNALWLARKLGVSRQSVYERMAKLHERGVNLPKLPRFDTQENKRLNTMIAEQLGEQAREK